jgi:iron complex outermembrane recepter protein
MSMPFGSRHGVFVAAAMFALFLAQMSMPLTAAAAATDTAIDEIIVTAQRREEKLSDVPISVEARTGDDLARRGIVDTKSLDQISPSLTFNENFTAASSSVLMRGASSQAVVGGIQPSTAVVIDGVPTARQAEFITDLMDIDRIEILGGPQGTLFGKNSSAGVINIVSKKPTDRFEGSAEVGGTTDGEYSVRGMVNVPLPDHSGALRVNAFYRNQDPLVNNIAGPDAYGRTAWGVMARLRYDFTDHFNVLLSGAFSRSLSTYVQNLVIDPISGPLGILQRELLGSASYGRGSTTINQDSPGLNDLRVSSIVSEMTWQASEGLSIVSLTGFRNVSTYSDDDVDSGPTGVQPGRGFVGLGSYPIMYAYTGYGHFPDRWHYFSQELRANYTAGRLAVVAGAYYQDYHESSFDHDPIVFDSSYFNGTYGPVTPGFSGVPAGILFFNDTTPTAQVTNRTGAVFGDLTYHLTDGVSLFGGLRQTRETYRINYTRDDYFNPIGLDAGGNFVSFGVFDPLTMVNTAPPINHVGFTTSKSVNNTSGRAGLQWQPTAAQNYYASFNRGYKGPAGDTGGSSTNSPQTPAILKPEISTSYEVGAKLNLLDSRLRINLALYDMTIRNIQQSSTVPGTLNTALINAGDLKVDGVEFSFKAAVSRHVRFDGGLAYTDARYHGGFFACNQAQTPGIAPCTIDNNGDGVADTQTLSGEQAIGSPKWKVIVGPTFTQDLPDGWDVALSVNYTARSSIQFQLGDDPKTREPSHSFVDASLDFASASGWSVVLYGKNLTNEFYYDDLNHVDGFIGQSFGRIARDSRRYGGLTIKRAF